MTLHYDDDDDDQIRSGYRGDSKNNINNNTLSNATTSREQPTTPTFLFSSISSVTSHVSNTTTTTMKGEQQQQQRQQQQQHARQTSFLTMLDQQLQQQKEKERQEEHRYFSNNNSSLLMSPSITPTAPSSSSSFLLAPTARRSACVSGPSHRHEEQCSSSFRVSKDQESRRPSSAAAPTSNADVVAVVHNIRDKDDDDEVATATVTATRSNNCYGNNERAYGDHNYNNKANIVIATAAPFETTAETRNSQHSRRQEAIALGNKKLQMKEGRQKKQGHHREPSSSDHRCCGGCGSCMLRLFIGIVLVASLFILVVRGVLRTHFLERRHDDNDFNDFDNDDDAIKDLSFNNNNNDNDGTWQQLCVQDTQQLYSAVDMYLSRDQRQIMNVSYRYGFPIKNWCVHKITNFTRLFDADFIDQRNHYGHFFDEDLDRWDTSNVTDMSYMFRNAKLFNGNVSTWNVSSVIDMTSMFEETHSFHYNNGIDIHSNSKYGNGRARQSSSSTSTLNRWDVSNVMSMKDMFFGSSYEGFGLKQWNVSSVIDMSSMFQNAKYFNHDITSWDISSVVNMKYMFTNAESFNQNLCTWGTKLGLQMNRNNKEWLETIDVTNMFEGTACPDTRTPNLTAYPRPGPFCHPC